MAKKINVVSLLPKNAQDGASEVTDLVKIKELLSDRSIVSAGRFILAPGKYTYKGVSVAEWTIGKGNKAKQAVMAVVEFTDGSITTLGNLRKVDASMKTYGPAMPLTEADLLESIEKAKGIEVKAVHDTYFTDLTSGNREASAEDPSGTGYKCKPGKIMEWVYAK